jgi:hypothetical protein
MRMRAGAAAPRAVGTQILCEQASSAAGSHPRTHAHAHAHTHIRSQQNPSCWQAAGERCGEPAALLGPVAGSAALSDSATNGDRRRPHHTMPTGGHVSSERQPSSATHALQQ